MKILIVNCTYKQGSTGKIVSDCAEYYRSQGHDVVIAYGGIIGKDKNIDEEKQAHKFGIRTEGRIHVRMVLLGLVMQYGGLFFSYFRLQRIIIKERPDIVHVHCINGCTVNIYRLFSLLSKEKIPTVITHHAEFYYTGSCGHAFECKRFIQQECAGCKNIKEATGTSVVNYAHKSWMLMKGAFERFEKGKLFFTAVSPWVKERSLLSPIVNKFPCEVVKNGINTDIFKYSPNMSLLVKRIPLLKAKVVLHVTGIFSPNDINHPKGGWYVVELAKRFPSVTFIVVATSVTSKFKFPDNLFLWGKVIDQQELAELYSNSDLTVITSKRETFSMVVAESLCCGTPVLGFEAGGPESITLKEYSSFVPFGNLEQLASKLELMISMNISKQVIESNAFKEYNKDIMSSKYLKIYNSMINA